MKDLMRISTFWGSAWKGLFGVFFASFSNKNVLLTADGKITLAPNFSNLRAFYFW
jgi:hypothetical protein